METAPLQRIARCDADARHDFATGNESGEQRFTIGLFIFRHREGWQECRGAGMNASARLTHVVELEGMSHGAIGERGAFR